MAIIDKEKGVVENVCHNIQIVVDKEAERENISPSIYMVPNTLRDLSPSSFNPRAVAIGPLHKKRERLQATERHKEIYMRDLFRRLGSISSTEETTKECVQRVHAKIDQIKSCYGGIYDNVDLENIMVVDACFILELILRWKQSKAIFGNIVLTSDVLNDLVLLENQIPFFVLEEIFECTIKKLEETPSLTNLVLSFVKDLDPFGRALSNGSDGAKTKYDHILGLFHRSFHLEMLSQSYKLPSSSYSAVQLARAGVKFAPNSKEDGPTMKWKKSWSQWFFWFWDKPTFTMPVLQIEDSTESVLRNLIAYEQCSPLIPKYVTSYAYAMDKLVDTKEDVVKLGESEVLVNNLGSNEDAAKVINGICKEVTLTDFFYYQQWEEIKAYYNNYWPRNIARLRRTYFNSPWNFIALLGALILFALTVVQTGFTIKQSI